MAVQLEPKLLDANRKSLYLACQKAAADGLVLDNRQAALVIFGGNVQYMPMVAGILDKVRRTGELKSISAHVVYKNDKFKHTKAPVESIIHESVALDEDPGDKIGAYAVAVLKSGEHQFAVMSKAQIEAVRGIAKTKMIWDGPFADQMWEKSAIRRLCKRLPSSSEIDRLFENDNDTYDLGLEKEEAPPATAIAKTTTAEKILAQEPEPGAGVEEVESADQTGRRPGDMF